MKKVEKELLCIEKNLEDAKNEYVLAAEALKPNLKYWVEWMRKEEDISLPKLIGVPGFILSRLFNKPYQFDEFLNSMRDFDVFQTNLEYFDELKSKLDFYIEEYYFMNNLPRSILDYSETLNNFKAKLLNVNEVLNRLNEKRENLENLHKDYSSRLKSIELELDLLSNSAKLALLSLRIESTSTPS